MRPVSTLAPVTRGPVVTFENTLPPIVFVIQRPDRMDSFTVFRSLASARFVFDLLGGPLRLVSLADKMTVLEEK